MSVIAVGGATLTFIPEQAARSALTPFLCLPCGDTGGSDLLLNIVLFLPLGICLAAVGWNTAATALIGFALSGLVEGLQYAVIPGRDASLSDLVANTAGAALGWGLWASRDLWLRPSPAGTKRLLMVWGLGVTSLLAVTHWGLSTDPSGGTWHYEGAGDGSALDFFAGRVLEVRLGGEPIPRGVAPPLFRERTVRTVDTVRLEAEVQAGPQGAQSGTIVSVADSAKRVATFWQHGRDLAFSVRTRGARLGLLSPRFLLPQGMDAEPGDTLELLGQLVAGRATLMSQGTVDRSASVQLTALDSWAFFWPGIIRQGMVLLWLRAGTAALILLPAWRWCLLWRVDKTKPPDSNESGGH